MRLKQPSPPQLLSLCCLSLLLLMPSAGAAGEMAAHVHGIGRLDLVWEAPRLQLTFSAPGADIVGSEGDVDPVALQAARRLLVEAGASIAFSPSGACRPAGAAEIEAPEAEAHSHHDGHEAAHQHESIHANWSAHFAFTCTDPEALTVDLFDRFPSLQRLVVQAVVDGEQTEVELTPTSNSLSLRTAR
jgi:hypothetical protein